MYRFVLVVIAVTLLTSSIARAASYLRINGIVVDPIMASGGGPHSYSGPNLEKNANLNSANLTNADLTNADLGGADLTWAART